MSIDKNRIEAEWTEEDVNLTVLATAEALEFVREGWVANVTADFDVYGLGRPCMIHQDDLKYGEHGMVGYDPGMGGWYIPAWQDSPSWDSLAEAIDYVEHENDDEPEERVLGTLSDAYVQVEACGICAKEITDKTAAFYDRNHWVHNECASDPNYDTSGE